MYIYRYKDFFINRKLAKQGKEEKLSYGILILPLYMDFGANFFVAGIFIACMVCFYLMDKRDSKKVN